MSSEAMLKVLTTTLVFITSTRLVWCCHDHRRAQVVLDEPLEPGPLKVVRFDVTLGCYCTICMPLGRASSNPSTGTYSPMPTRNDALQTLVPPFHRPLSGRPNSRRQ